MKIPIFYVLVGLHGSGKTEYAEKLRDKKGAVICTTDAIRKNSSPAAPLYEFTDTWRQIKNELFLGRSVIYSVPDSIYRWHRAQLVYDLFGIFCRTVCVLMATPFEACLARNAKKYVPVPVAEIEAQRRSIFIPQQDENWDEIIIEYNDYDKKKYDLHELFCGASGLNFFDQRNHHRHTLGEHCLLAAQYLETDNPQCSLEVYEAALLHDIGKQFTQTFVNENGVKDGKAHYFDHAAVSAYESLFYERKWGVDVLRRADIIQNHMEPYKWASPTATANEFERHLEKKLVKEIMMLHEADKMAKM